jgi:hypothetical protein
LYITHLLKPKILKTRYLLPQTQSLRYLEIRPSWWLYPSTPTHPYPYPRLPQHLTLQIRHYRNMATPPPESPRQNVLNLLIPIQWLYWKSDARTNRCRHITNHFGSQYPGK